MPADEASAARTPADTGSTSFSERRKNLLFRSLIDDMITQFRELKAHDGPWPADERARAEADLDRIMTQVRAEAFRTVD
jgi:hypothetical protein